MRLIPCPDCGRDVSPRAAACPNCGLAEPGAVRAFEQEEATLAVQQRIKVRAAWQWGLIVAISLMVTGGIAELLPPEHKPKAGIAFLLSLPISLVWCRHAAKRYEERQRHD